VDDFGAGQTSLGAISHALPIPSSIDKSFVLAMTTIRATAAIVAR